MTKTKLLQILEITKGLNAGELMQVQQVVAGRLGQAYQTAAREAFHRALLDSGLVKEIKTPPPRNDRERPLVPIKGKPLSETIVKERR